MFDIRITTIALRDIKTYFRNAVNFNPKRALYLSKVDADIPGYSFSYMDGVFPQEEYVMYEIPMDQDKVLIVPKTDNAEFNYMDQTYEFGAVTEDTCGFLTLATEEAPDGESDAVFEIHNHTWDSGKVTKPATTTAAGIKIFTCTDCGETKTESIAKLKAQKPAEKITITKKPSIKKPTAAKGKITVKWKHFKHTSKKAKKIWKKIKKVQVQCAADKAFKNKVKDVKIGRGKTKYAIKGLKKKTTYYVRVRYYDGTGYSAWSKVKKVKTK